MIVKSTISRVGAIMAGAVLLCAATAANALTVFSDDFVDGDISDWTVSFVNVIDSGALGESAGQRISIMEGNTTNSIEQFDTESIASASQTNFSVRSTADFTVVMPGTYDVDYLAKTSICVGCDAEAEVFIDGALQQTLSETGTFTVQNFSIFLGSGAHTITLGLHVPDTLNIGTASAFFDDIEISKPMQTVPEPGTLALFAFGLAGLGVMRRRRFKT